MRTLFFLLLLRFLSEAAWAQALPVKEERLGAWHYLYPLDHYQAGDAMYHREVNTPTALRFGEAGQRLAVLLPGSIKVAEFGAGKFDDLRLPEELQPLSLAVSRSGRLLCLVEHTENYLGPRKDWQKRWAVALGPDGWESPVFIPYDGCDRLEFDSQDRLWALGTNPQIGFFADGIWTTYRYSDDRHLSFLPLRLSEDARGRDLLFPCETWVCPGSETSHLVGTLIYDKGRFLREPSTRTEAFQAAEMHRYAEPDGAFGFDRAHGYVCHAAALNAGYRGPKTVLRTPDYWLVSLGNDGLLWARVDELSAVPPLATDEWETLDDISAPPAIDAAGNLWVGRGQQLLKVGPADTVAIEGTLPKTRDAVISFDSAGRPWVMNDYELAEGIVNVADQGVLRTYPSLLAALQAEAGNLAPGRILPIAIKTASGLLAVDGLYFDTFTIIDSRGVHQFAPNDIYPAHRAPRSGHGYNPFRGGTPWVDSAGLIYTKVAGLLFAYDPAIRKWLPVPESKRPPSILPDPPEGERGFSKTFEGALEAASHGRFVFKGFHFFAEEAAGDRQLDFGANPLAFYPFWTGWYSSPGLTHPRMDPAGHLWISALGPYDGNHQWLVLRKPAW